MRKALLLLLALALLSPVSASGAEAPGYIALTFEGFPAGDEGRLLLAELKLRDVRATFFLRDTAPEDAARIAAGGHELGLLGCPEYFAMSRRKIAASLRDTRAQLPPKGRVRLFRPVGDCSLGEYQVARVLGLTVLGWSQDPAAWARQDSAAIYRPAASRFREGDILRICLREGADPDGCLALVDQLLARGFRPITVSELARLRGINLEPGRAYDRLPERDNSL